MRNLSRRRRRRFFCVRFLADLFRFCYTSGCVNSPNGPIVDHTTEAQRLAELRALNILDTPDEQEFDDIVALAAEIAGSGSAYLSFLDDLRQWFKARINIPTHEVPRDQTICQYILDHPEPLVINGTSDAAPLPSHIQKSFQSGTVGFYAGVPIFSDGGYVLGTLCVVDAHPRDRVPARLVEHLERLSRQVSGLLALRRANALLFEERDTFSILFEAAPTPLLMVRDNAIVRANFAFAAMVSDRAASELESRDPRQYISSVPAGAQQSVETTIVNEVGDRIPVIVYQTRVVTGRRDYSLLAIADISDRKAKELVLHEQRLKAENANRIKDTFLSLVSHDLRSPLSGIFTMLDMMSRDVDSFSKEELNDAIGEMRNAAAVLVEMINQLLNIHRLQSGTMEIAPETVAVDPMLTRVLLTLQAQMREKDVEISLDIEPAGASLYADDGLVREAVFNLLTNAVKFSYPGGTVRVRFRPGEFMVEDDGPGVPAEDLPNLFRHEVKTSRLGTSGERGTGLGLPLVADIMRAHGGTIVLDESYTNGSRFLLRFPDAHEPASPDDATALHHR